MTKKTVVTIFDNIAVALQVVEDLMNANFMSISISLITKDSYSLYSHYLDQGQAVEKTNDTDSGFITTVDALANLLGGLTPLMIPGIGMAIVAGPIAVQLADHMDNVDINTVVDALVQDGVSADEAPYYDEGIRHGGTVVSIQTSEVLRAKDIMNRYGAINIHERINLWRQAGWKNFDSQSMTNSDTDPALIAVEKPSTRSNNKSRPKP